MSIQRFIALGDSLTEGLSDRYPADRYPTGRYRGWADRVADELARHNSEFKYANLAVRGKLVEEVIAHQVPRALEMADSKSTLITFHAGANNVLRPSFDPDLVKRKYRRAVEKLSNSGAQIFLFTVREINNPKSIIETLWNKRFGEFNQNVFQVASDLGAVVMDANSQDVFGDPRMLAADRLHLSSEGHRRVAAAVLSSLGLPHDQDWKDPMPPIRPISPAVKVATNALWGVGFLGPWVIRRVTGKSSGDNRQAKYPELTSWPPKG